MATNSLYRKAFTIVELVIVVTIIAILMTIMIVVYQGAQKSARDSIRKNDVSTLAKSINVFATQNGTWTPTNCGDTTNTLAGYVNYAYGVNNTIMTCLKNFDSTNKQISDPSGCVTLTDTAAACKQAMRGAYATYNCISTDGTYWVVAKLENVTNQTALNPMCATARTAATTAGFNYALRVR